MLFSPSFYITSFLVLLVIITCQYFSQKGSLIPQTLRLYDGIYLILLYLYAIIISFNGWRLDPGVLFAQFFFVTSLLVLLIEVSFLRKKINNNNIIDKD